MATTIEATAATALATDTLKQLEGAPLAEFLKRQRWFSSKHDPAGAVLAEVIPLFPAVDAVLAQVDVRDGSSAIASYLVPMALTSEPTGDEHVIARVKMGSSECKLVDAPHDRAFREALLKFLIDGRRLSSDGTQLRFHKYTAFAIDPATPSRVVSAEQSNTSIVYGDQLIVKLFRKLTPGENPDIEIGAYLTQQGADFVPALVGSATIDGDRGPTALLMAQRLVPHATDLWGYLMSRVPELRAGGEPFADEAKRLGEVTRKLHEALARAGDRRAFAPVRASKDDVVRWGSAIRHEVNDSLALLKRTDFGGPAGARDRIVAQGLHDLEHHDAVLRDVSTLEQSGQTDLGLAIRHHGDYHLGQVLRAPTGDLYIIDFEGEPIRPLAERRSLHSPLRDVAGMLRSFAYGGAMAALTIASGDGALDWEAALARASSWEQRLRQAFMEGYLATTSDTLPRDRATVDRLLRLFTIEKTFYELRYELTHRPDWVWVPLRGISEIVREALENERRPAQPPHTDHEKTGT